MNDVKQRYCRRLRGNMEVHISEHTLKCVFVWKPSVNSVMASNFMAADWKCMISSIQQSCVAQNTLFKQWMCNYSTGWVGLYLDNIRVVLQLEMERAATTADCRHGEVSAVLCWPPSKLLCCEQARSPFPPPLRPWCVWSGVKLEAMLHGFASIKARARMSVLDTANALG